MELWSWLEATSIGTWIRTSTSIWALPTIMTLHTFGMATLAGTNTVFALRVLGFAPQVPIPPLEKLFRVMWTGFALSAVSGTAWFVSQATLKGVQPMFYLKLALVALAMVNVRLLRRSAFPRATDPGNDAVARRTKVLAAAALVIWACVITTGRLMAYLTRPQ